MTWLTTWLAGTALLSSLAVGPAGEYDFLGGLGLSQISEAQAAGL